MCVPEKERATVAEKLTLLKQYFGHSAFRAGQETLIDALLNGQDVLGVQVVHLVGNHERLVLDP